MLSAVDSYWIFMELHTYSTNWTYMGYAAFVFHRKHIVYAFDSAKTSWGKIEGTFFVLWQFCCKNPLLSRIFAIRGKKWDCQWYKRLTLVQSSQLSRVVLCEVTYIWGFNRIMMPHTRSYYRVFVYTQLIIIPIDRNNQGEEILFHLS